jgi:tetratricopeptide (TPR) repeat protein
MKTKVILILSLLIMVGCSSSKSLMDKALVEENSGKPKLAKYLYIQVIEKNKKLNDSRFKALRGLARVAIHQLHDYQYGVRRLEQIISEYSQFSDRKKDIVALRVEAAHVWHENLGRPEKAIRLLELIPLGDITAKLEHELGKVYLDLRELDNAEKYFISAWKKANAKSDCSILEPLKLQIIQTYSLKKNCNEAVSWAHRKMFEDCKPDQFSIWVEEANCLEVMGKVDEAMAVYRGVIEKNPENQRAKFLLEGVKHRKKRKARK